MAITNGAMAGKTAKMTYSTNFVDGVDSISIRVGSNKIDITHMLTGQDLAYRSYAGGLKEGSGTVRLKIVNFGDTNGQLALWNAVGSTSSVAAVFYLDTATKVSGNIIIDDFSIDEPVDGVASGSISWTADGVLTPAAV